MIGRTLGHYRIESELGAGGMGVVYKAVDTRLDRPVAVKVLPADAVAEPDRKRRFIQEAKAASALNHPSILHVYDVGAVDGVDFIAMEYVDGVTLDVSIGRRGMDVGRALELAIQIAGGLTAAHAAGIVHRDIKPANIMVTSRGAVKILDFGVAKLREPAGEAGNLPTVTAAAGTRTGAIVGTAAYMSPEQAEGKAVDARADIFSFGAVLYEMLTGQRAFAGTSSMSTIAAVLREDPPPISEVASGVPRELSRLVSHCLRKDPEQRLQHIADVKLHLEDLAAERRSAPAAGSPSSRARTLAGIALATAAVVAAIGLTMWLVPKPGAPEPRFTPFATEAGQEMGPAWSPDGKAIAYLADINGIRQVLIQSLDSSTPAQITKTAANCDGVFWHPDGTRLYFTSAGKLWLMGIAGGDPTLILDGAGDGSVSPDGTTLAVIHERGANRALWFLAADGSGARTYAQAPFPEKFRGAALVRFSPEGSKIAIVLSRESGGGGAEFWIVPYPSGTPSRVLADLRLASPVLGFTWLPDGRRLVFGAALEHIPGLHLYAADINTGAVRILTPGTGQETGPSVSPDGTRIAFVSGGQNVDLVAGTIDGGSLRPLLATGRNEQFPTWSPNGAQYAYASNARGQYELWIRGVADGWARPVVSRSQEGLPSWYQLRTARFSPDGNRIVFELWGPTHSIWIAPVAGGRALGLDDAADLHGPSWSPDGNQIAYTRTEKTVDVWKLVRTPVGGGSPVVVLDRVYSDATDWVRARDGEWIAFSTPAGVQVVSPDGTQRRVLTKSNSSVFGFSRDGSVLYVVRLQSGRRELATIDVTTGAVRKTTPLDIPSTSEMFGLSLTPDGRGFATSVATTKFDLWIVEGLSGSTVR